MLESLYKHYQFLSSEIAIFQQRIAQHMTPYAEQTEWLVSIPGVDQLVAWHLIAELSPEAAAVFPQC